MISVSDRELITSRIASGLQRLQQVVYFNEDIIAAKIIPNLEFDENINEDFDEDWKTVGWWRNKCTLFKLKDKDQSLSLERENNVLVRQ